MKLLWRFLSNRIVVFIAVLLIGLLAIIALSPRQGQIGTCCDPPPECPPICAK
jgi:hypothetical protein